MPNRLKSRFEQEVIEAAMANKNFSNRQYLRYATDYLNNTGLAIAKKGMYYRSEFFNDIKSRLHTTLPVFQDYVNHLIDTKKDDDLLYFDEFESVIANQELFDVKFNNNALRTYLLRAGNATWMANRQINSHRELIKILWNDGRSKLSPQRFCLVRIATQNGKTAIDDQGNSIMVYKSSPWLKMGKKEVIEI